MKNGVINEGDRMKHILKQLDDYLDIETSASGSGSDKTEEASATVEDIEELLQELQDIVEQIDYAKSFAAMGGIQFLIGCASEQNIKIVPQSIRAACLAVLGTLCQNNPSVQYSMLEQGNIPKLINIYFSEYVDADNSGSSTSSIQARALQAMSCAVRNHDIAEKIFCMNQQGRKMLESALGLYSHSLESQSEDSRVPLPPPNAGMRRKALFFLQALVTSDSADLERINFFTSSIQYAASRFLDPEMESELGSNISPNLCETTLSMLTRILDQKKSVNAVIDVKHYLVGLGVKRISALRVLEGEEKEMMEEELRLWELLVKDLARGVRDEVNPNLQQAEAPLMIGGRPENDAGDTLAQ